MEEDLKCFMWHKGTSQSEGGILSYIRRTGNVVWDAMLGGKEPIWE